jgi:hypothetical protein
MISDINDVFHICHEVILDCIYTRVENIFHAWKAIVCTDTNNVGTGTYYLPLKS